MDTTNWGLPEHELLGALERIIHEGSPAILATIVRVDGSAYRRPGAKMVVRPGEDSLGGVTAGCLENDVETIAEEILNDGKSRLERYDLMGGDEDVWGVGMGCNGVIDLLLEPVAPSFISAIETYNRGNPAIVATVIEPDDLRFSRGVYADGWTEGSSLPEPVKREVSREIEAKPVERSRVLEVDSQETSVDVFLDVLTPPPELVIIGSGPDVPPVAELASRAGFRVTVVGYRGGNMDETAFSGADTVISTSPRSLMEEISVDDSTLTVIMTHNFVDDQLTLEALASSAVQYIGILGPRSRFTALRDAIEDAGAIQGGLDTDRIYSPIGLDIGSETPNQIALAIVGEVLAVANGREPKHLADRESPIHERPPS